jgi:RND family efflux transporter MFP subunit
MKGYRQWLAAFGVLLAGVAGFMLLHATRPQPETRNEMPRSLAVFVEPVRSQLVALDVSSQGEVRPRAEIELVSEVSGRVTWAAPEFVTGGAIAPGQVLLLIDDADYRFAAVRAEAGVAEAQLRVQQIEADAAVARKQLDAATATPLGLRKPQLADAAARLHAAEADLARARLDLARTRVSLPFAARIRAKHVDVGQFVARGTALGRAFSTDVAEVRLPLSDAQLASLDMPIGHLAEPHEAAVVEFTASVAGVQRHWHGRLRRIDATVDPATRVVHAVAEVEDPYGAAALETGMPFAIGMFVHASIRGRSLADARVIPRAALRSGDAIFVVRDGQLDIRKIQILHQDEDQVVVAADGVAAGEQVVVSPVRTPVHGMRVEGIARESMATDLPRQSHSGSDPA